MRSLLIALLLSLGALVTDPLTARAETYHVAATGNDAHDGKSEASAFATLQRAHDVTTPGDEVLVHQGTYSASNRVSVLDITRSGTAAAWIRYRAAEGVRPKIVLDGTVWHAIRVYGAAYLEIRGFEIEGNAGSVTLDYAQSQSGNLNNPRTSGNGIAVSGDTQTGTIAHHVLIAQNHVHDVPGGGIGTNHADYVTIEDNVVTRCGYWAPYGNSGITFFRSVDLDDNATDYKMVAARNVSFANRNYIRFFGYKNGCCITDGNGIIVDTNRQPGGPWEGKPYRGRTLLVNNVLYGNGGSGAHVLDSDNVDLINNTTYQNAQSNGETQDSPEGELYARFASNVRFLNNVIVARPGLRATQADTQLVNVSYDHNIYFDGDTDVLTPHPTGANDRKLDPLLVAPTLGQSADLRLRAESPAIDTGTLTAAPTTDLEGRARPHGAAIDLGAYEFGGVLPQQGTGGTSGTGGSASAPSGGQPSDPATGDASTTGGAGGEADPAPDSQDSAEWQDYGEGPRGCACTSGRGGSGRSRILWPAALLLVAFVRRRSARAMSSARTRAS